jgi:hypothetical protein
MPECLVSSVSPLALLPPHLAELAEILPPDLQTLIKKLPPRLITVLASSPAYVHRKAGAALVTQHITPVSHRSLEVWRVPWWHVNGKATTMALALFAVGYAKFAAAPMIMGGLHPDPDQHAQ